MSYATITNALLRCTRDDRLPESAFELVRKDLGLWVRELPEDLEAIIQDLAKHRILLRKLAADCSDYTLHLAITIDEFHSFRLPCELTEIAGDCSFTIEMSTATEEWIGD